MPPVTKNLIIINVLFFLGGVVATRYGIDLSSYLGLHFFMASDFNPAQLISYMFMHGGFTHLFFNMFAVWMLDAYWNRSGDRKNFFFIILPAVLVLVLFRNWCSTFNMLCNCRLMIKLIWAKV